MRQLIVRMRIGIELFFTATPWNWDDWPGKNWLLTLKHGILHLLILLLLLMSLLQVLPNSTWRVVMHTEIQLMMAAIATFDSGL